MRRKKKSRFAVEIGECYREVEYMGGKGGLVVGRRTCDLRVAGSRPGRDAAAQQP